MSTRAIKRKGAKVSVAEGEAPAEETAVVETTTVKNNSSSKNRSKRTKTATVDEAVVAEGVVVEAVAASAVAEEAVVAEADIAEDVAAEDNIKEKAGAVAAAEVVATTTTNITIKPSKPPRTANARFPSHLKPTDPSHFDHFLFQLLAVRAETNNANFNVHKDEYPVLYSWLQFIKKEYKNFSNTATTSQLTHQQIAVLESLHVPLTSRGDDHWNRFYEQLVAYKARHGHALVPRLCEVPGLGDWVTDQRRQYKAKQQGQATQLSDLRQEKLEALDFVWHVRNRPEWVRMICACVCGRSSGSPTNWSSSSSSTVVGAVRKRLSFLTLVASLHSTGSSVRGTPRVQEPPR